MDRAISDAVATAEDEVSQRPRRVSRWCWFLLLAWIPVLTWIRWWTGDPWAGQIEVRVVDARGEPIPDADIVIFFSDDKSRSGGIPGPVRFENGMYLLGLTREYADIGTPHQREGRVAELIVDAPRHGRLWVGVSGAATLVQFPDPAWATLSFDPPLDPEDLDRRFVWVNDHRHTCEGGQLRLDDGRFRDGEYRAGPFVPGGYSFALRRRPEPGSDAVAMAQNWDYTPDVILGTGENEYVIRR